MIETTLRIVAPHFVAGVILWDDKAVQVAPIVSYMRGWTLARATTYCERKGWGCSTVAQVERTRPRADTIAVGSQRPGVRRSTPRRPMKRWSDV